MMRLLSLLSGWKGYAAAAALSALLVAAGSRYVTSLGYHEAIAGIERDQAVASARDMQAALTQFQDDAGRIHAAADRFAGLQDRLDQKFDSISKDFHSAIKDHPLPADCSPDAMRLRQLIKAVAAANAAAGGQPGPAVPAAP